MKQIELGAVYCSMGQGDLDKVRPGKEHAARDLGRMERQVELYFVLPDGCPLAEARKEKRRLESVTRRWWAEAGVGVL